MPPKSHSGNFGLCASRIRRHRRGRVFPVKREILTNKDPQANSATEPKALIMAVPQADGETVMPRAA
jgi:hypothetical protein